MTLAQDEFGGQFTFVPRGRAHRATAKEIRGNGLASMIKEALDTCDEHEVDKLVDFTTEFEHRTSG